MKEIITLFLALVILSFGTENLRASEQTMQVGAGMEMPSTWKGVSCESGKCQWRSMYVEAVVPKACPVSEVCLPCQSEDASSGNEKGDEE
jgi:hypothetical protein